MGEPLKRNVGRVQSQLTMTRNIIQSFALLVLLSSGVAAAPAIAQSAVVNFPVNGTVAVEARDEVGQFPQMVFTSQRTHQQLLLSSIEDKDEWLMPERPLESC